MTNGVIYIASGSKFVAEAARSADSVKQRMPDLPITIFTGSDVSGAPFDSVVTVEPRPYQGRDKPRFMAQTPYERTLYLDADTYVCGDIRPLFALLDEFDFAAAHDPARVRLSDAENIPEIIGAVPLSFSQFNAGVIAYKMTPEMTQFLTTWVSILERHEKIAKERGLARAIDQTALREALYSSRVRVATLTASYNCRAGTVGFLEGPVEIMHGHDVDFERRTAELNRVLHKRVFFAVPGGTQVISKRAVEDSRLGALDRIYLRIGAFWLRRVATHN